MILKYFLLITVNSVISEEGKPTNLLASNADDPFRRYKDVQGFVKGLINTEKRQDRWLAQFKDYGCHCFGDNDHSNKLVGQGQPLDEIDRACRDLKMCRQCIKLSHPNVADFLEDMSYVGKNSDENKDPRYNWDSCDYDSRHNAKFGTFNETMQLCECDLQFVKSMRLLWRSDVDNDFDSSLKEINKESLCQMPDKSRNADKCCGSNPFSRPYNSDILECCDGIVTITGGCF